MLIFCSTILNLWVESGEINIYNGANTTITRITDRYHSYYYKKKKLNTTKKVVVITTNVVIIGVIATTKKSMQVVVINSEAISLCNTKFSLQ